MLGALISAGASLLGGSMAQNSAEKVAERNIALQKEFAQSGIQWKVEDAKAAGVHPLYALGASTHSFSPVTVGSPMAEGMNQAGQHVGRAITATQSHQDRLNSPMTALALERAGLENELLRSQIRNANSAQVGPAMPTMDQRMLVDGQGDTTIPGITVARGGGRGGGSQWPQPTLPGYTYSEPGAVPDVGWSRTPTGWAPIPSKEAQERMEDMWPAQIAWMLRNHLMPTAGFQTARPPSELLPPGHRWFFNPFRQEYFSRDTRGHEYWDSQR